MQYGEAEIFNGFGVNGSCTPPPMSIRKVAFSFLMLFIFSSFADLRFSAGGKGFFTLSIFEICAYLMVAALVACACIERFGRSDDQAPDKLHRSLLLYLAWGGIAACLVRGEVGKFMLIDLKTILPSVIAYFSLRLLLTSPEKTTMVITSWTCAGLVNLLLALSQFLFGGPHPMRLDSNALDKLDIGGEVARSLVTGFFAHPNSFSQILVPYFVVFATAWLLSEDLFSRKSLKLLLLGCMFGVILMLTLAKGAILWSMIALVMGCAMDKWRVIRSRMFFVAFWIFCVTAINSLAVLLAFNVLEYQSLMTLFSRLEFIIASVNIFVDHPLTAIFGGGMRFWEEYADAWATWDFPNAHNVYLNQMLLYGLIGLAFLVSLILHHVDIGLSRSRRVNNPLLSPLPYVAAIFAVTGDYFFEPSFYDSTQKFQLIFLLAVTCVVSRIGSSNVDLGPGEI